MQKINFFHDADLDRLDGFSQFVWVQHERKIALTWSI
eukprot:SAG31_NODE_26376_length_443_cov_1.119186_1_plen_36_part_10